MSEGFGEATWAPDGTKIAYVHSLDDGTRIELMNPDGSGTQQIGPNGAWAPAWSPDGSMIAVGRKEAIYVMNADGGGLRLLVAEHPGYGETATWSPDCSRVAFSAGGELWTMRPNGRVHVLSGEGSGPGYGPDWSPDGRKLVYWTYDDYGEGVGSELFVVNADGSGKRHLRAGATPAWSPDGSRIVFARRGGLATMNADGSDVRAVTAAGGHGSPDWQPLTEAVPTPALCDRWRTDFDALPRLRLSVKPRTARPKEPTRFRFRVTDEDGRRVRRAVIYFGGERTRTNVRGRAVMTEELPYNVRRRAIATKAGFRHDTVTVRTPPES